ncbi:hypothetical protein Hanom_Chr04g00293571 [Helianthus anomalus]
MSLFAKPKVQTLQFRLCIVHLVYIKSSGISSNTVQAFHRTGLHQQLKHFIEHHSGNSSNTWSTTTVQAFHQKQFKNFIEHLIYILR